MSDPRAGTPSRLTRAIRAVTEPSVRRILVVDDEDMIRSSLGKFLRSRGFEVTTCDSAALEALHAERYVAMLADVRMPGMSGLELVPAALALDADLAVMMLTAVNDAPTATEALAQGAMDYLMKPIELGDLATAVRAPSAPTRCRPRSTLLEVRTRNRWSYVMSSTRSSSKNWNPLVLRF